MQSELVCEDCTSSAQYVKRAVDGVNPIRMRAKRTRFGFIVPYLLQSAKGGLWWKPPPLGASSSDGLQSASADVAGEKPTGFSR